MQPDNFNMLAQVVLTLAIVYLIIAIYSFYRTRANQLEKLESSMEESWVALARVRDQIDESDSLRNPSDSFEYFLVQNYSKYKLHRKYSDDA